MSKYIDNNGTFCILKSKKGTVDKSHKLQYSLPDLKLLKRYGWLSIDFGDGDVGIKQLIEGFNK